MALRVAITGGGGVTGRAVARSLRMSPLFKDSKLIALDIFKNKYALFEGLFDKYIKVPHVDSNEYVKAFLETVAEERPDAVLIMTEKESIFWSNHAHTFPTLNSPFNFSIVAIDKSKLYESLKGTGLVPSFHIYNKKNDKLESIITSQFKNQPVWIRSFERGSTSGKGAFLANTSEQANAWISINESIENFLVSEVLPGRNFACNLLFKEGTLLQWAIYERLEYFMGQVAPSGITGNISVGKLVNDLQVLNNSKKAIKRIEEKTFTRANGIYTVDLKGDKNGIPMITEINLRHTAATSAFAQAGWNMAEFQLLAILERFTEIPKADPAFGTNNMLLRDIDGVPQYVQDFDTDINKILVDKTS